MAENRQLCRKPGPFFGKLALFAGNLTRFGRIPRTSSWAFGLLPQPKREGASRAFLPSLRLSLPMFIYEPQTREWRVGSSRVGAVFERREREQKRSGGEGGGSANILVRGIKCSVAFACSFLLRNHWRLLQHLDRRSQAEQSKIAGIGELLVRLVWKEMSGRCGCNRRWCFLAPATS